MTGGKRLSDREIADAIVASLDKEDPKPGDAHLAHILLGDTIRVKLGRGMNIDQAVSAYVGHRLWLLTQRLNEMRSGWTVD